MMISQIELDGSHLTAHQLIRAVHSHAPVRVGHDARDRVESSWRTINALVDHRPVYGRTTGVGGNRSTTVAPTTDADLRLLRSHATGSGPWMDPTVVRAGILIRLNQILRGGSGLHPDIVDALTATLAEQAVPQIHAHSAIGTGDLSALGELSLSLMGELDWSDGQRRALWQPHQGDALAIMSSNAFTAATATLAWHAATSLANQQPIIAALSARAMRGSLEAFAEPVATARPHTGVAQASQRLRTLLQGSSHAAARIQDSYGLRAFPQVTAALTTSLTHLEHVLQVEINASPENPLVSAAHQDVFHNGNFHAAALGQALDGCKIALYSTAALSLSRLTSLTAPTITGLSPFLAEGPAGSSGVMLLEYNQAAALASLRHDAAPASLGSVVISLGVEDHSSFATQAAQQLHRCLDSALDVFACELLAAARATHLHNDPPPADSELADYLSQLDAVIDDTLIDRPLSDDLARTRALLAHHTPPAPTT